MILGIADTNLFGVRGKYKQVIRPAIGGIIQMAKEKLCKSFIIGSIPISPSKTKDYQLG